MPQQPKSKAHWMDPDQRPLILTRQQTARIHFASRLHSRHGLHLTGSELHDIVRGVKLGRATKLTTYEHGRNLYCAVARGKLVLVVFDFHINQLVSIMPPTDVRLEPIAKNPGRALTKWLQESKQAAKEAAKSYAS